MYCTVRSIHVSTFFTEESTEYEGLYMYHVYKNIKELIKSSRSPIMYEYSYKYFSYLKEWTYELIYEFRGLDKEFEETSVSLPMEDYTHSSILRKYCQDMNVLTEYIHVGALLYYPYLSGHWIERYFMISPHDILCWHRHLWLLTRCASNIELMLLIRALPKQWTMAFINLVQVLSTLFRLPRTTNLWRPLSFDF